MIKRYKNDRILYLELENLLVGCVVVPVFLIPSYNRLKDLFSSLGKLGNRADKAGLMSFHVKDPRLLGG